MTDRWIALTGALLAAAAVGAGAFHAHGLEKQLIAMGWQANLDQRMAWFETAVRYQMYHALACLAVAALRALNPSGWQSAATGLFVVGVGLFCGSLYAMTFLGDAWRKLGMVTPAGGLALIVGWLCLAVAAAQR